MAAFERFTTAGAAPARHARVPRASADPVQRALDHWHREQPEIFAREPGPAAADAIDPAERAIALNHLLNYERLAGERDLGALRDRTMSDGSRQAEVLEQSVQLAEAVLRQDPSQYETLVADADAMVEGLGLEDGPRQALGRGIRKRLAGATLLAQTDPVAGDPDIAAADLERGRFRDAFDAEGIAAWRELVAANRARAAAEAARVEREAGIVAEVKMLNRLAAAGRAEAPMPTPAEIEAAFPGESEQRLKTATRNRQRSAYAIEIAAQPFDRDTVWIEAATSSEDRAIRLEAVQQKRREFARSGGGNLLKQYPALGAAIREGIEDPSKLDFAIELYQRQLAKLGVPPAERGLLPRAALQQLADQYQELLPAAQVHWRNRLEKELGEVRSSFLWRALDELYSSVQGTAKPAQRRPDTNGRMPEPILESPPALEIGDYVSEQFTRPGGVQKHYEDFVGAQAATQETLYSNLPGRSDGPADAYRHILWAAELTRRFGEIRAREILDLYEERDVLKYGPNPESTRMDRHNNEIGIRIGRDAKNWEEIVLRSREVITASGQYGGELDATDKPRDSHSELAVWLEPNLWSGNPTTGYEMNEIPLELTNWFSNLERRAGVDWMNGVSPNPYRYPYGDESFRGYSNDEELLRAIGFLKLDIERRKARQ